MKQLVLIVILAVGLASCRPDSSARIVAGRSASLGELPYQASLQFWGTSFNFAGASLINTRWVVTTAQGLVGIAANSVNIVLGVVRLDAPITSRRSSAIRIHPLYDAQTGLNDIATVQSSVVIVYSSFIAPITLSPTFLNDNIITSISGWGATTADKTVQPIHLQVASVTTVACGTNSFIAFNNDHVCTRGTGIGICTNDIGGPLVLNSMLVGIPFFHDPRACATQGTTSIPDGHLRITSYRTWILGNTIV